MLKRELDLEDPLVFPILRYSTLLQDWKHDVIAIS